MLEISKIRLFLYLAISLVTTMAFVVTLQTHQFPGYTGALTLAYILALLVPFCLVFGAELDPIEPILWFSLLYFLIVPGAVYFAWTDFETSEHLLSMTHSQKARALEKALLAQLAGYVAFVVGYYFVRGSVHRRPMRFRMGHRIPDSFLRLTASIALAIGLGNFLYIALSYPGGWLDYLTTFGLRHHRLALIGANVTQIGYQFLTVGLFLWMLVIFRNRKTLTRSFEIAVFLLILLACLVAILSNGRMLQFLTSVLVLWALALVYRGRGVRFRQMMFVVLLILGAVLAYTLRVFSVESARAEAPLVAVAFFQEFGGLLGYWLIDKGNVPDLAVVMNILTFRDLIDFYPMLGKSFVSWVSAFSPMTEEYQNVGRILGDAWYGIPGGVPPTIVGEVILNFGVTGIVPVMMILGVVFAAVYRYVRIRSEFLIYVVYLSLLFKFVFVLPKGEISNIVGAIWHFAPTIILFGVLNLVVGAIDNYKRWNQGSRRSAN